MAFSGNALTVGPPESIQELSPELYAYLRQLNKTIHENYERQESGAATFPASRFLLRYVKQDYPLGSEGRFVHEDYGVLRGVFVRFADTALETTSPVGWDLSRIGEGYVTRDSAKSEAALFVGLDLTHGPGEYGWVLSQGILPAVLAVSGDAEGEFLEWADSGLQTTKVATGVRIIKDFDGSLAPIGSIMLKPSSAADGGSGVEADLAALLSQIATINGNVATLNEDFAGVIPLKDQFITIQQKLEHITQSVTVVNRMLAEFNPDYVLAQAEQTLAITRNYYNLTRNIAEAVDGQLQQVTIRSNAALISKDQAKGWADQSGIYAEVSSERAGYASLQAGDASISAAASFTYRNDALAYRDAAGVYAAQAQTYSQVAAQVGSNSIIQNPTYALWDNAAGPPNLWSWWAAETGTVLTRALAATGGWVVDFVTTSATGNAGLVQSSTLLGLGAKYVVTVEAELVSGVWNGAGISIGGVESMHFASTPDVNGVVSATQLGYRRWSVILNHAATGSVGFYLMANWAYFSGPNAKRIRFNYSIVRVVDAQYLDSIAAVTNEAIARASETGSLAGQITTINAFFAGLSGATVQASINSEATARTNADSALSTRVDTVDARFVGLTGTVLANINTAASAYVTPLAAQVTRIDALDARFVGLTGTVIANINSEATARANADTAITSSVSTLSSTVDGHTATLTTQAGTLATVSGRTSSYWSVTAVAGGRAQLTVYSDSVGGAGVDIVGDVRIKGIVTAEAFITDQGINLGQAMVPGTGNWRLTSGSSTDYGGFNGFDSGVVMPTGFGAVYAGDQIRISATISGQSSNAAGFVSYNIKVYYSLNGGAWTYTGLQATASASPSTAGGVSTATGPFYSSTSNFGGNFTAPGTGTIQFAYQLIGTTSAGNTVTAIDHSMFAERTLLK